MSIVRDRSLPRLASFPVLIFPQLAVVSYAAQSRFLVSGSADNEMRLWSVQTGKCLFTWEFPTAVKRVSFSDDDEQIVCITEQRMGHQDAICISNVHRDGDDTVRACVHPPPS
jgi:WD40 repeat protein